MQNSGKNFLTWLIIFAVVVAVSNMLEDPSNVAGNKLVFSEFMKKVDSGDVTSVDIKGSDLIGKLKDGSQFYTYLPDYPDLVSDLKEKGVAINAMPLISKSDKVVAGILGWLPFIIMIALWVYMARGAGGGLGRGGAFGFGRSRARLLQENKNKVTFADVAGIDEAKQELTEIVDFLKDAKKYVDVGAKIPRGCLLIGSPGTGKTLLARAIAGEAGVPFFSISGSDFVEMFVGVGASRVRDMFEQAKKSAPCIVFIDEIDAVGRHRGSGIGGGNDEREQTLNQMLVEMDGFSDNEGVVIIAATNRPDVLDRALLRPGRFDRQVTVPNPDIVGREQILTVHMKKIAAAADVDLKILARGTPGFAGADLANLVNEAALTAARHNQKMVTMQNFEEAKDKIMMGTERKSMVMQKSEKELTAYHEAGHAITALNCQNSDPIHKATIIPRGRALGLVMRLPENDRFSITRAKLKDDLIVAFGGRAAEELIFGYEKVTTGASSDIEQATMMARNMVTKWGLSDKIGAIDYSEDEGTRFYAANKPYSEETGKLIDEEVKRIADEALEDAKKILLEKRSDLEKLAKALLEYETLTGDEIKDLLAGKEIRKTSTHNRSVASVIGGGLIPKFN
ncbi:MAG: ATP-dependent metallopeptidase FtsH/Yme1/Tma family protein [Alphaproteobacteria bacterium]|nr:ATP-dependent metallopeptidase FtsH/Yme1/Tma family protein [Alphaproteobacteria bacterium]